MDPWSLVHKRTTGSSLDYHGKIELEKTLEDAVFRLEKRTGSMTKCEWEGPMPDVRFHHIYPTLGHAIAGILVGHVAEHISMLSMWRYFLLDS